MHDPREPHLAALKRIIRYVRYTLDFGLQLFTSYTGSLIAYFDADWAAETAWIRNLLRELHTPLLSATLIYCDNASVISLSNNPVQHQQTHHVEIDILFVREMVTKGQVRVLHVPSHYQYDDIFS
ncbi:ribonuclease H-like domain-containing protein [Tanacetum coccineum]